MYNEKILRISNKVFLNFKLGMKKFEKWKINFIFLMAYKSFKICTTKPLTFSELEI